MIQEVAVNGLPGLKLSIDEENSVTLTLFGAHVTSWVSGGEEQLFMSNSAVYNGVKAIRGGIPLVFPQFGRPLEAMAQHGFARNSVWSKAAETDSSLTMVLHDSENSRESFPYTFTLLYTVSLSQGELQLSISAENPQHGSPFDCHMLLHTYFKCDTKCTVVRGFGGLTFQDHLGEKAKGENEGEENVIEREVDRHYKAYSGTVVIASTENSKEISITTNATLGTEAAPVDFPVDVVFWNAWVDKCKATADLDDDAYQYYVCIEPGTIDQWVKVIPGATLTLTKTIRVKK